MARKAIRFLDPKKVRGTINGVIKRKQAMMTTTTVPVLTPKETQGKITLAREANATIIGNRLWCSKGNFYYPTPIQMSNCLDENSGAPIWIKVNENMYVYSKYEKAYI